VLTITSFQNGYVSWNNVDSNLYYTVEYRPNLSESNLTWDGSYRACQDVKSTNAIITVPVGVFYRVVGSTSPMQPAYTRIIRLTGSLDFGTCASGSTQDAILTIWNDGDCAMTVTGIQYSDSCFSGNWSGKLSAGGSTNITVTFVPVLVQAYSGTLTVNCDKTSGTNFIACTGTAAAIRYVDNGDGTVTDTATGLMWMKNANPVGGRIAWADALTYCDNLVTNGYSDWRLPTVGSYGSKAELDTLFRANGDPFGAWEGYEGTPFTGVRAASFYWSGTTSPYPDFTMVVIFDGNGVYGLRTSSGSCYVWPVRGGQ
jgi:hypothetical protein